MSNERRIKVSTIKSPNYEANYRSKNGGYSNERQPCLICGKSVNKSKVHWVNVDCTTNEIVEGSPTDHWEYGCQPIGADCFRRHKEILQGMEQR